MNENDEDRQTRALFYRHVEKSTSILMETLKNLKIDIGDVDFLDVENQHQDVEK